MIYKRKAEFIIKYSGGKDNIYNLDHCFTRLRYNVKNAALVDKNALEDMHGIISVIQVDSQLQIVIGSEAESVYKEMKNLIDSNDKEASTSNKSPVDAKNNDGNTGIFK